MKMFKLNSIKNKIIIPVCLFIFIILVTINIYNIYKDSKLYDIELNQKVENSIELSSKSLANAIWAFNQDGINEIGEALFKDKEIANLKIISYVDGNLSEVFSKSKTGNMYQELIVEEKGVFKDKEKIGIVKLSITKDFNNAIIKEKVISTVVLVFITLFIVILVISKISNAVTKAIIMVTNSLMQIASSNDEFTEEKLVIQSNDEIGQLVNSYNIIQDKQKLQMEIIKQAQNNVRNLLDNAKQGFLSFSADTLINKEYSAECERIFERKIEHENFADLLFPTDEEKKQNFNASIREIFKTEDPMIVEVWFKLLPKEVFYNEKFLEIDYKVIEFDNEKSIPKTLMVIISDISEKRNLEIKMKEEQKVLKMVVGCVTNYKQLLQIINEFNEFCDSTLSKVFEMQDNKEIINTIFREVHTFKGNFGQLDFVNIASNLHNVESEIHKSRNTLENYSKEEIKEFFLKYPIKSYLEADMEVLKNVLGENYFDKKGIQYIKSKLIEIEERIQEIFPDKEAHKLIDQIRQLRYEPLNSIITPYLGYSSKLAERMEKMVDINFNTDPNILVDVEKYSKFSKALVHVFRNSIDHGIEEPEERHSKGKDFTAKLECTLLPKDNMYVLSIRDDGRGIDIEKIKQKAIEKNILTESELTSMDEKQVVGLIFREDFSTKDEVTDISGRGVGLNAVKFELENLGGHFEVETHKDEGTNFIFYLPILD